MKIGSYLALDRLSQSQARALRESQLGRVDRIVSYYYAFTDPMPKHFRSVPTGSVPMISWRGTTYAEILDGTHDDLIAADAEALVAYGKPLFLRFAWEMNGDWFDWGGPNNPSGPDGYVRAWRHVYDIFAAAGAANVTWVWSVNWNDNPETATNKARLYYPGDAYVDWIAVDGFSGAGESPEHLFGSFYREYAGRKPLMIAETAVTHSDEGAWIAGLGRWLKARPEFRGLVWFDTDLDTGSGKQDWRVDANPAELAAYRRLVNDPYFTA
ncbi:MAG TPA: glycosyl hydrolase [Micromonosporaceae bacterium]